MKQTLNLRLGHKLKLTPRLQQAITLLQLSSMDLDAEIRDTLEQNPFLEESDSAAGEGAEEAAPAARTAEESEAPPVDAVMQDRVDSPADPAYGDGDDYEDADRYGNAPAPTPEYGASSGDYSAILDNLVGGGSIADRLREQIRIAPIDEVQHILAEAIIENINADGYLEASVDELLELLAGEGIEATVDDVEAALAVIQTMEPAGIGARDLRECLTLQLAQCEADDDTRDTAMRIVGDHLDLLSRRDLAGLRRATGLDQDAIGAALGLIRTLDPRPGRQLDDSPPPYVVPDLVVRRGRHGWKVELNNDARGRLRLSPASKTYLSNDGNREEYRYLRQRYQEAKWFLQSLQQRNDTILRVAREIIRHQSGFLEEGERAMRPLTLKQVADTLGLHESTVSRATSSKYILSPRGTFELKYFFSSQLSSEQGDAMSATAIQAQIRTLIAGEPEARPISDQKIADHFKSMGITVARRTVAKYREQMHIPPSSQRKGFL